MPLAGRVQALAARSFPAHGTSPVFGAPPLVALGAIEAKFYLELLDVLGLNGEVDPARQQWRQLVNEMSSPSTGKELQHA